MQRGVVLKLYGDAQISGAIADGMARALPKEQIEVVEAEIDRQRIQRSLVRVAANNSKTPEDYACMTAKTRWDYRWIYRKHGRLYGAILGLWGLLWMVVAEVYDYFSAWNREG